MNPSAAMAFLDGLARAVPALPRADCRSHRELFDDLAPEAVAQAVQICKACAELEPCCRWAEAQPPRSLLGVVGGTLRHNSFRHTTPKEEKL